MARRLDVPGADPAARRQFHQMYRAAVSPDDFATLGTRIVRGRGIEAGDGAGAPGAVVVGRALVTVATAGPVAPLLFEVSPRDPLVYAAVVAAMLVVATVEPRSRAPGGAGGPGRGTAIGGSGGIGLRGRAEPKRHARTAAQRPS